MASSNNDDFNTDNALLYYRREMKPPRKTMRIYLWVMTILGLVIGFVLGFSYYEVAHAGMDFSMSSNPEQRRAMVADSKQKLSYWMAQILTAYGESAAEGYSYEDTMSPKAYKKIMDSYFIMQSLTSHYTAGRYADMEDDLYKMDTYLKNYGNGETYPMFRKFREVFRENFKEILAQTNFLGSHVGSSMYAGEIPQ